MKSVQYASLQMALPVIFFVAFSVATASAQRPLPNPVKTCEDVRAYIGPDQSMTMDTFKSLLTAGGTDLSKGGDNALDMQCKVTAFVKHVVMIQRVLGTIRVNTHVVMDGGVCKLTEISLTGC